MRRMRMRKENRICILRKRKRSRSRQWSQNSGTFQIGKRKQIAGSNQIRKRREKRRCILDDVIFFRLFLFSLLSHKITFNFLSFLTTSSLFLSFFTASSLSFSFFVTSSLFLSFFTVSALFRFHLILSISINLSISFIVIPSYF